MKLLRTLSGMIVLAGIAAATPASAQFFLKSHDMRGAPATGLEPGVLTMPGATDDEMRAGLVWNLRSALNVAALQCQFAPTLLTVENYNAVLANHKDELQKAFDALNRYFVRTAGNAKAGQNAFDKFGTRTYSSFTTVGAQYGFCQTAGEIAAKAAFAPRGHFFEVAIEQLNTLRNALVPWGEERFPQRVQIDARATMPRFDDICWDKKGGWVAKKCGAFQMSRR